MMGREEFLNEKIGSLLGRLSPPRSISKSPELQKDEVRSISGAIKHAMPHQQFESWWWQFEERLLSNHETRAWPTLREIKQAASFRDETRGTIDEDQAYLEAVAFFEQSGKPCPWSNRNDFTARMLQTGRLSSLAEARSRGFSMTSEQNQAAKSERMSMYCWDRHIRVMARLTSRGEAETARIEAGTISEEVLPLEVINGR